MRLTQKNHSLINAFFTKHQQQKNIAVDATCGNGFDTEFLCQIGFNRVWGFDIQALAIQNTEKRLKNAGADNYQLQQSSHCDIPQHVKQSINCTMFNLGYLPKTDQHITTKYPESLQAIKNVVQQSASYALVSILCYPGHPQGAIETQHINQWVSKIGSNWQVDTYKSRVHTSTTPILYLLRKVPFF